MSPINKSNLEADVGGCFNYGYSPNPDEIAISNQSQYYHHPLNSLNQSNPQMSAEHPLSYLNPSHNQQIQNVQNQSTPLGMTYSNLTRPQQVIGNGNFSANGQQQQGFLNNNQPHQNPNPLRMTYSNLPQPQGFQNGNVGPSGSQLPAIIPNLITNLMSMEIDEGLLRMQLLVNNICFIVLLVSAPIVIIIYAVFLTTIAPPLDLFEIGNWWTFLNLFLSCLITIGLCGFAVGLTYCSKGHLGAKMVSWINVGLLLFAMLPVFLNAIGIAESSKKKGEAAVTTDYGLYVKSVCENSTFIPANNTILGNHSIDLLQLPNIQLNAEKCTALKTLKIGILSMMAWGVEIVIVVVISGKFGLRVFNQRFF